MKQPIDGKCRMCCKAEECIKHIVAGCTTLAPSEYTNTYNKVAGYIQWNICKHMGLHVTDKYYRHIPAGMYVSMLPILCGIYRLSQMEHY